MLLPISPTEETPSDNNGVEISDSAGSSDSTTSNDIAVEAVLNDEDPINE